MDRYLEAIEQEEVKEKMLKAKKKQLLKANEEKEEKKFACIEKKEELTFHLEKEKKRKYYLDNRIPLLKKYRKKALSFGIKSAVSFVGIIFLLQWLGGIMGAEVLTISVLPMTLGSGMIGAMLGVVEFQNVSREYRQFVDHYKEDIDSTISSLSKQIEEMQTRVELLEKETKENNQLLVEVENALKDISKKIEGYRSSRNQLIQKLMENLDSHITNFTYQGSNIEEVIEKKIH